jgi:hypothetical protein
MNHLEVHNQNELERALEKATDEDVIVLVGNGTFTFTGSSAPRVEARGSSAPLVEARGSSAPRVEARGSSAPLVVAWESSAPRVEARGSSAPRVEARGSSAPLVVAWESSAPLVVARGSSAPLVVAWESSAPRVEAWESSAPLVVARGSSAPLVVAWESSAPLVVAWESSAPLVVARGSSAPRVVARGSSAPRVEAWESSAPRVEARGSSAPRVEARGSSAPLVVAWESSAPRGSVGKYAAIVLGVHDKAKPNIPGAIILETPKIETSADWCDYYGAKVEDDVAILFKAVDDDYSTGNARGKGIFYTPGSQPEAPDWDGGKAECGGGLHFSPHPVIALQFNDGATKFVACPVALSDIVVHKNASYPNKIKAPRVCAPVFEVDRDGEPVS